MQPENILDFEVQTPQFKMVSFAQRVAARLIDTIAYLLLFAALALPFSAFISDADIDFIRFTRKTPYLIF